MKWRWLMLCLPVLSPALALAQQPAAPNESLEPAVNTSAPAAEAPAKPAPAAATPTQTRSPAAAAKPAVARKTKGSDRLELDTTQITGNRELPKVMYIVPWKRADLGDLAGRPVNSLLDEVLAPVDRDVFKRENRYYRALQPGAAAPAAAPAAAKPSE